MKGHLGHFPLPPNSTSHFNTYLSNYNVSRPRGFPKPAALAESETTPTHDSAGRLQSRFSWRRRVTLQDAWDPGSASFETGKGVASLWQLFSTYPGRLCFGFFPRYSSIPICILQPATQETLNFDLGLSPEFLDLKRGFFLFVLFFTYNEWMASPHLLPWPVR
ncbi:hypothetical protein LX36DRAFT_353786 [Colletotrichum falcatum]|nr:hypothetical protein LX36DRAFT_353786 [Colletotrichum falcatum]